MGPGIAVAATGVGAGDMISATNAGAKFGTVLLLGHRIRRRAQVRPERRGRTLAACDGAPRSWKGGWNASAGPSSISSCSTWSSGPSWSAAGCFRRPDWPATRFSRPSRSPSGASSTPWPRCVLVWAGRFGFFLKVMKVLIGLMFVSFLISAWALRPDLGDVVRGIALPSAPSGFRGRRTERPGRRGRQPVGHVLRLLDPGSRP